MDNQEKVRMPIPAPAPDGTLNEIRICDDGNELVTIRPELGLHVDPIYHRRSIPSAPAEIRLRADVAAALVRVAAALPAGVELLLWDGLRSVETQSDIVEAFRSLLPDDGDQQATIERYLAVPPASEREFRAVPPPHATGGAIDLTLCDTAGTPLDLGAEHDQFDAPAWLRSYEHAADGPRGAEATDVERGRLRRLLYWSMCDEGFSPYAWEYWHFELGTSVEASFHRAAEARYGAAVPWPVGRGA